MTVSRVKYSDFRNIVSGEIELSPGVNVFLGNNAEGKTNALEGIYLMAAGKSFRTPREREMVRFGADHFEVTLSMTDSRMDSASSGLFDVTYMLNRLVDDSALAEMEPFR